MKTAVGIVVGILIGLATFAVINLSLRLSTLEAASASTAATAVRYEQTHNDLQTLRLDLESAILTLTELKAETLRLQEGARVDRQEQQALQQQTARLHRCFLDLGSTLDHVHQALAENATKEQQRVADQAKAELDLALRMDAQARPVREQIAKLTARANDIQQEIERLAAIELPPSQGENPFARAANARRLAEEKTEAIERLKLELQPVNDALEREHRQLEAIFRR